MNFDEILTALQHYRDEYLNEPDYEVRKWLIKIQQHLIEDLVNEAKQSLIADSSD